MLPPSVAAALRRAAAELGTPVVLVVDEISRDEVLTAMECRVVAVVPRAAATGAPDGLTEREVDVVRLVADGLDTTGRRS